MRRRSFVITLGASAARAQQTRGRKYAPEWESLRRHQTPKWFEDAKLGIFVHWGLYSVPAWATPSGELGKIDFNQWFYVNPYAEWYLNTLRLKKTRTAEHHAKTYGTGFDYYRFAETFHREVRKWDPAAMAALFHKSGARYVVLTTKHHDGFTLWPSEVPNPRRRENISSQRDVVGDLTAAVRQTGMRMGLYYSGGLDWTFEPRPVANLADLKSTAPQTAEYAAYADAHWRELIDRYQPSILWNDITYPKAGKLAEIFADFYNRFPEGLVNNRFGVEHADTTTPEYEQYNKITEKKWESCRGLGFSFGYNQIEGPEHVLASDKLIAMIIDIVSKNGNLLLNVGPKPDGSIAEIQQDRLRELGKWMAVYGEGIHGTRPWVRAAAKASDGSDWRFTRKDGAVFAFVMEHPKTAPVVIPDVIAPEGLKIQWIGQSADLKWRQHGRDLLVDAPNPPMTRYAAGLRLNPAPRTAMAPKTAMAQVVEE